MCGLVGFINREKKLDVLEDMLKVQSYRGPDDKGMYFDLKSGIHFAHNRLSIQDLSVHGHQPFLSDCEEYVIVFNGEVYNFNTIRTELEDLDYCFTSNSDTEVILYAYKEWGIACLEKFIGMFAFSILDKKRQKMFLVRDRAGVKPLYYYTGSNEFIFASEIKSLHEHPNFVKELNKDILPYYFQFGYIPAPYTVYKNCHKLLPGHYLEYNIATSSFEITQYWDVTEHYLKPKIQKTESEIVEDLENLILDSCQLRMVSDVPVGVFLSGGYDSSTVVSLLQAHSEQKINTYTIGFEDKEFNEANHAKNIAQYLGTNHTEYYCTQNDLLELIDDLPYYWDEPFADASALPTMIVSKLAKRDVTVALSADGGDEAFFGYSKYFAIEKIERLKQSKVKFYLINKVVNLLNEKSVLILNTLLPKSKRQTNIVEKFKKFKNAINASSIEEMFIKSSSYVEDKYLENILTAGSFKNFQSTQFSSFSKLKNIETIDAMMAIDYQTFMVDDVLTKVDRATMSVSLEGREPLLDHRIVEYLATVPTSIKYKDAQGKYLLRQVLYKYLPQEMVDKPKAGFTIPLEKWLKNELKNKAIELLQDPLLTDDQLFKPEKLEEIISNLKIGVIENPNLIWMIMMYVSWRQKW